MKKLVIVTTVPLSLSTLVKGQPKYLSQFFDISLITSKSDVNRDIQEYEGVEVIGIDMTRKITPLQDLKSLLNLYRYFRQNSVDIVYSFTPKAGLLSMIASFFARVPKRAHNIVGMPLMEASGNKKRLLKIIEKITYSFATNLFCNSYGLKDYIEKNLTKKEIRVIANGSINGVDIDFFRDNFSDLDKKIKREELGIEESDFVLLFVGRVVKDKGVNELIKAFSILDKKINNLKLLMVGDFEEELSPIAKESIDEMKNNPNIISVGFKKDIRSYLSISDLFVLPSYREGLPNSLIEAGSFGIPLLATDINGCNEVIIPNKTGILVEKKSVDSLVNGVTLLIENRELYSDIKTNVRDLTIKRYSQEFFFNSLKDELEKL